MRIKERMTAVTVAAMALVVLASTQVSGVASADESYGEFTVGGRILESYKDTGGNAKWGDPTRNESAALAGGRFQTFENDVSFYWKASVAGGFAHPVAGKIFTRWAQYKWERGPLGYPIDNEVDAAGKGTKQFFQGGNMYTGASTGTHPVWGQILNKYAAAGGPAKLGLPVGDEYKVGKQFRQDFQTGRVVWP